MDARGVCGGTQGGRKEERERRRRSASERGARRVRGGRMGDGVTGGWEEECEVCVGRWEEECEVLGC